MVVLLHSVQYNELERIFLVPLEKIRTFSKNFFFKQKQYLALSTMFSNIQMLLSQPSSLKELINFIVVIGKP